MLHITGTEDERVVDTLCAPDLKRITVAQPADTAWRIYALTCDKAADAPTVRRHLLATVADEASARVITHALLLQTNLAADAIEVVAARRTVSGGRHEDFDGAETHTYTPDEAMGYVTRHRLRRLLEAAGHHNVSVHLVDDASESVGPALVTVAMNDRATLEDLLVAIGITDTCSVSDVARRLLELVRA